MDLYILVAFSGYSQKWLYRDILFKKIFDYNTVIRFNSLEGFFIEGITKDSP